MEERTRHLLVKVKSLASEAKIIRETARKAKGMEKWELNHHRKTVVRVHSRHNLLAYGLIKGTPYSAMERYTDTPPAWNKVENIARRFGADEKIITEWVQNAKSYLERPAEQERLSA